ncbi:MAG: hypothetical protein PHY94_01615 [Candidatus Omnitrophica bacterium]|nr:hypothetical protein [Candidatus Omnitrophota bacterium]
MKKSIFLSLILICVVIVVPIIIFTRVVCEDEDSVPDIFCNINGSFEYEKIFASIFSCSGILYEHRVITVSPRSIMAYLERHEKSPPLNPAIFVSA